MFRSAQKSSYSGYFDPAVWRKYQYLPSPTPGMINFLLLLAVGAFVGAAAGYLGSFMVLKRMSLVGDALSHVALPGLAIAISLHQSPILGAFVALTLAVVGIWYLQETTALYTESLVGVFFTTALALGVLITPEPDLLEALFGNIQRLSSWESLSAIIISVIIIIVTAIISKKLMLGIVSEELAKSLKVRTKIINFIYLFLVGTVVALGVKFVGSLLMGALVIIPAVSAKNISKGLNSYYFWSAFFGIISAVTGTLIAQLYHISSGPIVVLTSIFFFLATYTFKSLSN
jgi:ABC-type Mn2+/Zn2+ transport system permease subunit